MPQDHGAVVPFFMTPGSSDYHTRTKDFSHPLRCYLSFTQRFFHYKVFQWWNSLPSGIKGHGQFNDCKDLSFVLFIITMFIVVMFYWFFV